MWASLAGIDRSGAAAAAGRGIVSPLLIAVLLAMAMVMTSQVRATRGDSFGLLVVSQSILETGSIRLDRYRDYFLKEDGSLNQVTREHDGHLYHFFPVGAPVLSLPVVAVAQVLGFEAREFETPLQKLLAALSAATLVAVVYAVARRRFRPPTAAALGVLCLVGTIVGPTLSSALWSLNYELALFATAMLLVLRHADGQGRPWHPWALGIILFLAFLVRPTAAGFILWTLLYLLVRDRGWFVVVAASSAGLLAAFLLWNLWEFGSPLPPYYSPGRLGTAGTVEALSVAFLSASRNVLIWNPVLLVLPLLLWQGRRLPLRVWFPLLVILLSGLSFFLINIFTDFGGKSEQGWSFGPRIYTTMAFAAFLAAVVFVGELRSRTGAHRLAPLVAALALGALVNLPGIYNPYTWYWNSHPNVVGPAYLDIVNDWRFPQFLVTRAMLERKAEVQTREFGLPDPGFLPIRGTLLLGPFDLRGDSDPFRLPAEGGTLSLRILAVNLANTTLRVALDDREIGEIEIGSAAGSYGLSVPLPAASPESRPSRIALAGETDAWLPGLVSYSLRVEP